MKSVQYCSLRYPMLCTPSLAHVAKRHRGARRVLGVHPSLGFRRTREHHLLFLVITVWFPYLRWFLLVILNLPAAIAVRALLTIIYPATAGTMWTKPSLPASLVSVVHYRSLGIKPQFPDRPGCDPSQRKYCTAVGKESVQYRSRATTDYGCSAVVFELRGRGVGARSLAENGRTEDSVF